MDDKGTDFPLGNPVERLRVVEETVTDLHRVIVALDSLQRVAAAPPNDDLTDLLDMIEAILSLCIGRLEQIHETASRVAREYQVLVEGEGSRVRPRPVAESPPPRTPPFVKS